MLPTDQLAQLLTDVAPLLDLEGLIGFEQAQVWTLAVDEDTLLQAEYNESAGLLRIDVELAPLPPNSGSELLETLLIYNDQQGRTGGIHLALDGPGGSVIQSLNLAVADLDASRLSAVLGNYIEVLRGWREILGKPDALTAGSERAPDIATSGSGTGTGSGTGSGSDTTPAAGIRV